MDKKERFDRIMVNKGLLEAKAELNQGNLFRAILMVVNGSHIRAVEFINGDKVIADFMEYIVAKNYDGAADYLNHIVSESKKEMKNDNKSTD